MCKIISLQMNFVETVIPTQCLTIRRGSPTTRKHDSTVQYVRSTIVLIVSSSHTGILRYCDTCPYMNPSIGMATWGGGSSENTPKGCAWSHKSAFLHINK